MTKKAWLVGSGTYDGCCHGAIFTDKQKADEAIIKIQKMLDEAKENQEAFIEEIEIDPENVGGWRYWVIEGKPDSMNYGVNDDPKKDTRYPSYSMIGDNNEEVGACGLGYTKEEAYQNALKHIKQLGLRKLGLSINEN